MNSHSDLVLIQDEDEENNNRAAAGGEGHVVIKPSTDVQHTSQMNQVKSVLLQHTNRDNESASPTWLPGPGNNYLTEYPWLELPKSSRATSTVGSAKSSRSRRSQKVTARVKWCRALFLTSIICASGFLVFYPLITHYIVEAAHANESFSYFPFSKENCTLPHKHSDHSNSVHAEHHSRLSTGAHGTNVQTDNPGSRS